MKTSVKQTEKNEKGKPKYFYEIAYPITAYKNLNEEIRKLIQEKKQEFLKVSKNRITQKEFLYTLYIHYIEEKTSNTLSFLFQIESSTGGAHPNHELISFSWNKEEEIMITIKSLSKKYPEFLKKSCYEARKELLKKYPELLQNKELFLEGTRPFLQNYEVFLLKEKGITYFFPPYQIAPYYMGEFEVTISYKSLGL